MRWIIRLLAALLALIVIALATVPLWLGAALADLGRSRGLTFARYERLGYRHFALHDVVYRRPGLEFTAERVEAITPVVWGWQHLHGGVDQLRVGRWAVAVTPAPKSPPSGKPSGWVPLREQIGRTTDSVNAWLPDLELGPGTVRWTSGSASVAAVTWKQRRLVAHDVRFHNARLDLMFETSAEDDELVLTAKSLTDPLQVRIASTGPAFTGKLEAWGNPAPFDGRLAATGWVPTDVSLHAAGWKLPGTAMRAEQWFQELTATAQLDWHSGRFSVDTQVHGTPAATARNMPALAVDLRAHGDPKRATVQWLDVTMPGATARLTEPVTITRDGHVVGRGAVFIVHADLAQVPGCAATGVVRAEARVESGLQTPPRLTFVATADELHASGLAVVHAGAEGDFAWPLVRVTSGTLTGTSNETLRWRGGWDLQRRELTDTVVDGDIRRTTLARWMPAALQFDAVAVDLHAHGPAAEIAHEGTVRVTELRMASLKPAAVQASWRGTGARIAHFESRVQIGPQTLTAAGAVEAPVVRLSTLTLQRDGVGELALAAPAELRWAPQLTVTGLKLAGPHADLDFALTWGAQGHLVLAGHHLPSGWVSDVLTKPVHAGTIDAVAVTANWDRGPAAYSVALQATAPLNPTQTAQVNLAAHGDAEGLRIDGLRVSEADGTVANATGKLPLTVTPAAAPYVALDSTGPLQLDAKTAPEAAFWDELGRQTGIALTHPEVELHVKGSWAKPQGAVVARARRVTIDRKTTGRELPSVTNVDVQLLGDRAGVELKRFSLAVEGQPVNATGHVPFPEGGWNALAKDPLDALRRGADARVDIPDAQLGAFKSLLAKVLAPTGSVRLEAGYRNGALTGRLVLHGAATEPLGPLGVVRDIDAEIALQGRTLVLQSVHAQTGGSPIKLDGKIELPVKGEPRFDLTLAAQNVPFVRETGLLVRGDVDLRLLTGRDGITDLTGRVNLRDSLFLRDLQSLAPRGGGGGGGGKPPPYFAISTAPVNTWRVNVQVTGDRFMKLETPVFSGVASAHLQLLGTLGAPRAIGTATLDRGQVLMPFATFVVQHGNVRLTEANPDEPQLDITAGTRKYGYDLTLNVTGSASAPTVEFSSTPPLQSDQILLLVMAGVAPNDEIATSTSRQALQIGAFLGKGLLGGANAESRLTIESGADVSEQGKPTYEISYALTPRWTVIGEYDRFDEYVGEVKWQFWPKPRPLPGADAPKPSQDSAKLVVKGIGWLHDRKLRSSLNRLLGPPAPTVSTNTIEDAAVILLSAVKDSGYQDARLDLKVTDRAGREQSLAFDPTFAHPLPRGLAATRVEFDVSRGTRWHVTSVNVTGLTALPTDKGQAFFHSDEALFNASANAYSPSRLSSAAGALRSELQRKGYVDATVTARVARETNGAVEVAVTVRQGPRWTVTEVTSDAEPAEGVTFPQVAKWVGQPLAPGLQQDVRNEVRRAYYGAGYPDAEVSLRTEPIRRDAGAVAARLRIAVAGGPRVRVGAVRFAGNRHTKESVLRGRVPLQPGEPLDLLALEKARYRISRLGVFEDVQLKLDPPKGPVRDPVFAVQEAPRFQTSLLAGYGSYEQVRVGVEAREQNLFGHAHESRIRAVQSMKSTTFDWTYTIPALLGEDIDGTAEVYGLRRREIAFLREEFGTSFALQKRLPNTGGAASIRYGFGALANRRSALLTRQTDRSQINVGSITLSLTGDRRDHPLNPRHGYNWLTRYEVANPSLGGVATFQRLEVSGAYHTSWGKGRWIHLGLSHGVVTTFNRSDTLLPVNRRFYPGGANSIRGYQNGEAAPRDAEGRFVGAKSFVLLNAELEQAILPKLSAVAFFDALGEAASIRDYPWDQRLYSVGLGLRYQTVVGPVRVEYGRNVHPRPHDPSGTWQISIGYPF